MLEKGGVKIQGTVEELKCSPGEHLEFFNPSQLC